MSKENKLPEIRKRYKLKDCDGNCIKVVYINTNTKFVITEDDLSTIDPCYCEEFWDIYEELPDQEPTKEGEKWPVISDLSHWDASKVTAFNFKPSSEPSKQEEQILTSNVTGPSTLESLEERITKLERKV